MGRVPPGPAAGARPSGRGLLTAQSGSNTSRVHVRVKSTWTVSSECPSDLAQWLRRMILACLACKAPRCRAAEVLEPQSHSSVTCISLAYALPAQTLRPGRTGGPVARGAPGAVPVRAHHAARVGARAGGRRALAAAARHHHRRARRPGAPPLHSSCFVVCEQTVEPRETLFYCHVRDAWHLKIWLLNSVFLGT